MKQVNKLVGYNKEGRFSSVSTCKCPICHKAIGDREFYIVEKTNGCAVGYAIHLDELNNHVGISPQGESSESLPYEIAFECKANLDRVNYLNKYDYLGISEDNGTLKIESATMPNCQNLPLVFKTLVSKGLANTIVTIRIHGTREVSITCTMKVAGLALRKANSDKSFITENVGKVFDKKVAYLESIGCKVEW